MLTKIKNEYLTVVIDELGAQMLSIKDRDGFERLWDGDERYWKGRAPILFPIAGALKDDSYYFNGKRYSLPKHGYIRNCLWKLEYRDDSSAAFVVNDKHPGFPFDYELRAKYTLSGAKVKVDYQVNNIGRDMFYYGIGSHEGFKTPGGLDNYFIQFDKVECLEKQVMSGSLMTKKTEIIDPGTNILELSEKMFKEDALVFLNLKSRGVTLVSKLHNRKIRLEYPDSEVLLLWTIPGAEYICIEPWKNAPDYVDSNMQICDKPGCILIHPGERKNHVHTIGVM